MSSYNNQYYGYPVPGYYPNEQQQQGSMVPHPSNGQYYPQGQYYPPSGQTYSYPPPYQHQQPQPSYSSYPPNPYTPCNHHPNSNSYSKGGNLNPSANFPNPPPQLPYNRPNPTKYIFCSPDTTNPTIFPPRQPTRPPQHPSPSKRPQPQSTPAPSKNKHPHHAIQSDDDNSNSNSNLRSSPGSSSSQYSVEYHQTKDDWNRKQIDPVFDTPDEIQKWIEARKKNYPKRSSKGVNPEDDCNNSDDDDDDDEISMKNLSKLEIKLRKQIKFLNTNPKAIYQRSKQIDLLKNILTNPEKHKRIHKSTKDDHNKNKNKNKEKFIERLKQKHPTTPTSPSTNKNQQKSKQKEEPIQESNESVLEQKIIKSSPCEQSQNKLIMQKQEEVNEALNVLIKALKERRDEMNESTSKMLDYKTNSISFKHTEKMLLTNMVIEDVFKESCYLLQGVRYIVGERFFEDGVMYEEEDRARRQREGDEMKIKKQSGREGPGEKKDSLGAEGKEKNNEEEAGNRIVSESSIEEGEIM